MTSNDAIIKDIIVELLEIMQKLEPMIKDGFVYVAQANTGLAEARQYLKKEIGIVD